MYQHFDCHVALYEEFAVARIRQMHRSRYGILFGTSDPSAPAHFYPIASEDAGAIDAVLNGYPEEQDDDDVAEAILDVIAGEEPQITDNTFDEMLEGEDPVLDTLTGLDALKAQREKHNRVNREAPLAF